MYVHIARNRTSPTFALALTSIVWVLFSSNSVSENLSWPLLLPPNVLLWPVGKSSPINLVAANLAQHAHSRKQYGKLPTQN